jgi:hypothetical protein
VGRIGVFAAPDQKPCGGVDWSDRGEGTRQALLPLLPSQLRAVLARDPRGNRKEMAK